MFSDVLYLILLKLGLIEPLSKLNAFRFAIAITNNILENKFLLTLIKIGTYLIIPHFMVSRRFKGKSGLILRQRTPQIVKSALLLKCSQNLQHSDI